jgi:hypothetical protein
MIELTEIQHLALEQSGTGAIRAVDPATNAEYVLVPADVYERIKALIFDNETWATGGYPLAMESFARDGWDDPRMDVYDSLDPRRQP